MNLTIPAFMVECNQWIGCNQFHLDRRRDENSNSSHWTERDTGPRT